MDLLNSKKEDIEKACKQFKVAELFVFGSVLTKSFNDTSDIDFVVEFDKGFKEGSFVQFFGFKEALEQLLGRRVDLVCYNAIRNPYFKSDVDSTKKLLYAA